MLLPFSRFDSIIDVILHNDLIIDGSSFNKVLIARTENLIKLKWTVIQNYFFLERGRLQRAASLFTERKILEATILMSLVHVTTVRAL